MAGRWRSSYPPAARHPRPATGLDPCRVRISGGGVFRDSDFPGKFSGIQEMIVESTNTKSATLEWSTGPGGGACIPKNDLELLENNFCNTTSFGPIPQVHFNSH